MMSGLGIEMNTTVREAVERYPQVLPVFQRIGMCCVHSENENWTVAELCARHGVDADSFVDTVNALLK